MKRLAIFGASGHGKVVADTAECCGWESVEFFDDAWPEKQTNGYWNVKGDTGSLLNQLSDFEGVVVAIGNNVARYRKLIELKNAGANVLTLIHPRAYVSRHAVLKEGSVVFAGVQVNADTQIGIGAILNTGCSVDHDCLIGDAVHISPGAHLAGGVRVGNQSWIGIGAVVRHMINIGENVIVGAGSAVVCDILDDAVIGGVPARKIR